MNRSETSSSNSNNNERRNALIIAGFLTIFMGTLAIYFGFQTPETSLFLVGALGLLTAVSVVAGWLSYKGHVQSGMLLIIATFLPLIVYNQINSSGDSLLNGLIAVTVTAGIAFSTLSGKWQNRSIVAGVFVGFLIVIIDVFGPANRPDYEDGVLDYLMYAVLIGIVVFLIVRQLRDATLRPKLITGFAFIALIGSLFTFATTQFVTISFTEDAVPNEQLVGQMALQARAVQAEALEFISLGKEETVLELNESSAEIAALSTQVHALADNPEEAADFEALVDDVGEITKLAQNLVQSHQETLTTLTKIEAVEEVLQDAFVAARAEIDEEITKNFTAGELDKLEKETFPKQTLLLALRDRLNLLIFESVEFVAQGDIDALEQIETTTERLKAIQSELDPLLDADLKLQLNELNENVQSLSQSLITSHTNTLDLLQQISDKEKEVADSLQVVEGRLLQKLTVGEANSNKAAVLSTVVALGISGALGLFMSNLVTRPVSRLVTVAQRLGDGDLSAQAEVETSDEIGTLATAFNDMAVQLRQTLGRLDRRVQQMEVSAAVSQRLSTILDEQELVTAVVTSLQAAFNYYHVHIYLLNQAGDTLIMAGGTGDAGAQMLANNHALAVGRGLVGGAAETNSARLVPDVSQSETWVANPLLPETKSEIAVPIVVGDEVLGVLDVQSNVVNGLQALDLELLQAITNQIAIALQNARQYQEVQRSHEAIRAREVDLSEALKIAKLAYWEYDVENDLFTFNDQYYALFNTTAKAHGGYQMSSAYYGEHFVYPDDLPIMGAEIEQAISSTDRYYSKSIEHRILYADGGVGYVSVNINLERDEHGKILSSYGATQDITERKQAEETLRESESRLVEAADLAQLGYWELDIPTMIFTLTDEAFAVFYTTVEEQGGYQMSAEEYAQKFVHPDYITVVADETRMAIETDDPNYTKQLEHRFLRADGSEGVLVVEIRLIKNERGETVKTFGVFQDITERKQFEEALQKEQERAQSILESISVPFAITRMADGKVIYCNEALGDLVGVSHEELIGQDMPDFYANPADREAYISQLRTQGFANNFDLHMKRGNSGELYWALLSGRVIEFQGEQAIITFALDINERRKAQALVARRATELQTVAELGNIATTILEPDELLQQVVELTKGRFELYHAHIYLMDENQQRLTLTNGAGETGRTMVAEGRQIALNQEQSLVARAARSRQGVVINDVQAEPGFLPHPLLPNTRAEMAVPIVIGDNVQGVLDVQADIVDRFTSEDINIFTTLAAQVAVALQNARRYEEAQRALDELTRLQRVMAREGWEAFLLSQNRSLLGYAFDSKGVQPISEEADALAAVTNGHVAAEVADTEMVEEVETAVSPTNASISIPITVRGEQIGQLGLRMPDGSPIPERNQRLLQTVTHQMSEALERVRLFEETEVARTQEQKRAAELSLINAVSEMASSQLNTAELFNSVGMLIQETFVAESVYFALYNKQKSMISFPYFYTKEDGFIDVEPRTMEDGGLSGRIIETQKSICQLLQQDDSDSEVTKDGARIVGARDRLADSFVGVPMIVGRNVVGVIGLSNYSDIRTYSEQDQQLLESLAGTIGVAVQNAQQFEATQRRAERESLINTISQKIQSATTVEGALQTAVSELGQALKLKKAVVELSTNKQNNGQP